jgi:hypothetical protein
MNRRLAAPVAFLLAVLGSAVVHAGDVPKMATRTPEDALWQRQALYRTRPIAYAEYMYFYVLLPALESLRVALS